MVKQKGLRSVPTETVGAGHIRYAQCRPELQRKSKSEKSRLEAGGTGNRPARRRWGLANKKSERRRENNLFAAVQG